MFGDFLKSIFNRDSQILSPIPTVYGGGGNGIMPLISPTPNPKAKPSIPDLVKKYFPEDTRTAMAIFQQESQLGKYPQNLQGAPAYGVTQVYLPFHRERIPGATDEAKITWLQDPENNLSFGRKLYEEAGNSFNPWEAYTTQRYKQFLR